MTHDIDLAKLELIKSLCSVVTRLEARFEPPLPKHIQATISVVFQGYEFTDFRDMEFPLGLIRSFPTFALRIRAQGFTENDILTDNLPRAISLTLDKYYFQTRKKHRGKRNDFQAAFCRSEGFLQDMNIEEFQFWRMSRTLLGLFRYADFTVVTDTGGRVHKSSTYVKHGERILTTWYKYEPIIEYTELGGGSTELYSFTISPNANILSTSVVEIYISMGSNVSMCHQKCYYYFIEERLGSKRVVNKSRGTTNGILQYRPANGNNTIYVKFYTESGESALPLCCVRITSFKAAHPLLKVGYH